MCEVRIFGAKLTSAIVPENAVVTENWMSTANPRK